MPSLDLSPRIPCASRWAAALPAILVLAIALGGPFSVAAEPAPSKAKVHGVALSGRISRMDPTKMTFAVRDGGGREVALTWTAATKITGGDLKTGELVTLRYFDKDSKHIAATIHIGAPATPAPKTAVVTTPAAATTPAAKTP